MWVLIRRRREKYLWHMISSTILFTLASLQVGLLIPIFSLTLTYQTEYIMYLSGQSMNYPRGQLELARQLSSTLDVTIILSL
jgi:hypothetical protein